MRHTAPGNKQDTMYYILSAHKFTRYIHMRCLNIQTYKNPFPQPRGPKNSSVGRQTFLHTPLRLGQDQGKDAASFSTTVMMGNIVAMFNVKSFCCKLSKSIIYYRSVKMCRFELQKHVEILYQDLPFSSKTTKSAKTTTR